MGNETAAFRNKIAGFTIKVIITNCLHPSGRKEIMKLLFQLIFKDLVVKLFKFCSVLFGFAQFHFISLIMISLNNEYSN